jgi:hypothetical protein
MRTVSTHYALSHEQYRWLRQFTATFRTQYDFLLAQRREDPKVYDYSAAVLIQLDGEFITLPDLVKACGKDHWTPIYEAWAWKTGQRLRAIEQHLSALEAAALRVYAREFYEITYGNMMDALQEARELLEGPNAWSP